MTETEKPFEEMNLSECIYAAVQDLEAIESRPDEYKVNMSQWHYPDLNGCNVCLGGSVMANRLGIERDHDTDPQIFAPAVKSRLIALNCIRQGYIRMAQEELGTFNPSILPKYIYVTRYHVSPDAFKRDVLGIADMLSEYGL